MELTVALLSLFLILGSTSISCSDAVCEEEKSLDWSYHAELKNGPQHWNEKYPKCSGKQQSPINIETANVVNNSTLKNLELINYDVPMAYYKIENTGYTIQIQSLEKPQELVQRTVTVNGEKYSLSYIQFHWGDKYYRGSDHIIDNIQYAFEMQLVHANKERKIAVVSVLYESSLYDNIGFKFIVNDVKELPYSNYVKQSFDVESAINLSQLVTNGCSFYRYNGSLTIPECDEGVIWTICKNPSTIGYKQLNEFRKLHDVMHTEGKDLSDCKLVNNFRPIQPLNGRKVTAST